MRRWATSPRATFWSRARRSSPSDRTCTPTGLGRSTPAAASSCPASSTPTITSSRRRCAAFSPTGYSSTISLTRRAGTSRTSNSSSSRSPRCTGRRTCTSTSCSDRSPSSTTVHDISQIHHSPAHSDAAIQGIMDSGRRAAFGYFEGAGFTHGPDYKYPDDAARIKQQWFSSSDQLVTMIMGGEIYLPGYEKAWKIGRELKLQVAAHILSPFGMRPTFDLLAQGHGGDSSTLGIGPDNLFVHMTGMSDMAWQKVKDVGAQISLAVPIEMNMRHGTPPLLKLGSLGLEPSLSSDVEVTMTADFFTQMRCTMNMQRVLVNQMVIDYGLAQSPEVAWPAPPPPGTPALLTTRDVLRFATINGAKHLRLDGKTGSLTPGKEADIIILDATRINVAPLNQVPGAVVSLMDRSNAETVIVAAKVRTWKGRLLDAARKQLPRQLEASRDYIFSAAGIAQNLFRSN